MERRFLGQALGLAAMTCALLGAASAASADVFNLGGVRDPLTGQWTGTASLEMVPVGDAGNVADTAAHSSNAAGQGRVDYNYNIGKYEVTSGQYKEFLNAVAATDTYSLYHPNMAGTAGITQSGGPGSYMYTVDPAFANRPVNYVSYWDACRFANWLSNGQGGAGTTEYGTYALNGVVNPTNSSITRNATGATWAVTSEDEWYKAAYYNPAANNYYLYPTGSNTAPGRDMADVLGNNANYYIDGVGTYRIDGTHFSTVVGEFQNSASPYGTFDQGGNVTEWNDSIFGLYRGLRGGSSDYTAGNPVLQSFARDDGYPTFENFSLGFRVSQVPEPASLGVLGVAVVGMLVRRRGRGR